MNPGDKWKIVLIDDEEDIREVITLTLEDAGYRVHCAADGISGLRLCADVAPQIVITDVRMPKMSGIEVLQRLKADTPEIEVIVATAFGEMELAIRALQLDASDFITKPINDQALHLALKRARNRYRARKQVQDYTALLEREQARTTQELIDTIALRNDLIEHAIDAIVGCDRSGTVIIYNRSMERLTGRAKSDVLHQLTLDAFFTPSASERLRREMVAERFGGPGKLLLYETELLAADQGRIPVQVSAMVLTKAGQETGWVLFFRDLGELRRLEREVADQARILHQDKMISLGRLAASVVHEINNPLSGILNYLRLMLRITKRGEVTAEQMQKFQRYLHLVETETTRCSQIVSNLLTFSRKSAQTILNVAIDDLLQRCLILSRHKLELSNIVLETAIAKGLPNVRGDFNQLQQCVINLIFNAVDAMPEGGTLTIGTHFNAESRQVTIEIQDTGRGIDPRDLPHIFEPFFTTKQEGSGVGLGLSTVYGIVQRHGGTISAENRPGSGTCFTLCLPA